MTIRTLFPAPLWSLAVFALWLLLARSTSAGHALFAAALAVVVPRLTVNLRFTPGPIRRPVAALMYLFRVGADVVRENLEVAWGVLAWRRRRPRSGFVVVPLDLRDPRGLAALAIVTTVVPGTIWSELATDRSAVRLHVWDVADEPAFIARYKDRYEYPLREIFE
jgi:multicomponent K+:H+ antiporter subunit E